MFCPFLGFGNSDLQKRSSGKVGSIDHNALIEIQSAISREVDVSIKVSMQKKLDERTTKTNDSTFSIELPSVVFFQQAGQ